MYLSLNVIFGFLLPENDEQNDEGCLNFNPGAYPYLIKVFKKISKE